MENSSTKANTLSARLMSKLKEEFDDVKDDLVVLLKQYTALALAALVYFVIPNWTGKNTEQEKAPQPVSHITEIKNLRIQLGTDCIPPTKVASWKDWRIQLDHANENEQ